MVGACSMVNSEGLGGWQWDINILMIPNVDLTSYDVFLLLVTMFFLLCCKLRCKLNYSTLQGILSDQTILQIAKLLNRYVMLRYDMKRQES